jgi:glutamyl-tRNA synthetase
MIRTRFAPSPTGYLHIGGVRTALFCWLFARRHGGQFILRIDDTDQERNVAEALAPILQGLRWLGLDWDEGPEVGGPFGPYYQSQRRDHYQAAVDALLAGGCAYRDYATTEEIQAERQAAQQEGRAAVYSRRFMAGSAAEAAAFEAQGRKGVVRLKMPRQGTLVIHDLVRGDVEFPWAGEQDHVIQRADGSCLYHLASVVDDYQFRISHVIRAEEHLSNTPRQAFIALSLGYPLPEYAHLPFVAEPGSKTKLSKRKLDKYLKDRGFAELVQQGRTIAGRLSLATSPETFNPVVVDFYRQIGFLPEAIINYLALLGWSWDDKAEHFRRDELVEKFSLERVNKAPASFDPAKLLAFQDWHMRGLPLERKVEMVLPYLGRAGLAGDPASEQDRRLVARILEAAGDRVKLAGDILSYGDFFVTDESLPYDEPGFAKVMGKPEAAQLLARFRPVLESAETFEPAGLERLLEQFVAAESVKPAAIVHPLRMALTGKSIGFGLFDTLSILGKPRALARIDRALARCAG